MVSRNLLQRPSSVVECFLFVFYLSVTPVPAKGAPKRDLFLTSIAQVRGSNFLAILSLLIQEQFLFLHLSRSSISQAPVRGVETRPVI